jgi:hypothetical protein
VDFEDADHPVACDQRYPHTRPGSEPPGCFLVHLGVVDDRVDPLASSARKHAAALRVRTGDRVAQHLLSSLSGYGGEAQLVSAAWQGERDDSRRQQLAQAADNEIEQAVEICLGGERVPYLLERLELARPAGGSLEETGVFDCHGSLAGEER